MRLRFEPGAIRWPQILLFLSHLLLHISGKLLVVWDVLPAHRIRWIWAFVRQQKGRLWLEFLPAYAPELNPVEDAAERDYKRADGSAVI